MGSSFDARCNDCGEVHEVSLGGGFTFMLLHCDVCGKPKSVSLRKKIDPEAEDPWGRCRGGGDLSTEAPPRCPKCRSTEFEPIGNFTDYD
jgi:hypothetical protein